MKPNNYKLNRLAPEHQHTKTYHHMYMEQVRYELRHFLMQQLKCFVDVMHSCAD